MTINLPQIITKVENTAKQAKPLSRDIFTRSRRKRTKQVVSLSIHPFSSSPMLTNPAQHGRTANHTAENSCTALPFTYGCKHFCNLNFILTPLLGSKPMEKKEKLTRSFLADQSKGLLTALLRLTPSSSQGQKFCAECSGSRTKQNKAVSPPRLVTTEDLLSALPLLPNLRAFLTSSLYVVIMPNSCLW